MKSVKVSYRKVLETLQIEEKPPIDDKIRPSETFVEHESVVDFKGFEALHSIGTDIDNQLLAPMFKRKLDICMMNCNDRLRHFSKMLTK